MHGFLLLLLALQIHLSVEMESIGGYSYVKCHTICLKGKLSLKILTLRSQAFLGMSFKSAKRSSCSLSKSSFPIGPTAPLFIGLSLNDLSRKLYRTMMLSACAC